ncbi:hypothetical protein BXZ70DRAFT_910759 [Cristinia sonorae]|uniref:Uncharacterized protein n=1 Tax=Cristinia sonorae TaxID=1940300 RepID=A0A8K0UFT0_9AGAR|nr:hypothetical protein BXZ70DRAFT_910759 [Cristinia sonorae]
MRTTIFASLVVAAALVSAAPTPQRTRGSTRGVGSAAGGTVVNSSSGTITESPGAILQAMEAKSLPAVTLEIPSVMPLETVPALLALDSAVPKSTLIFTPENESEDDNTSTEESGEEIDDPPPPPTIPTDDAPTDSDDGFPIINGATVHDSSFKNSMRDAARERLRAAGVDSTRFGDSNFNSNPNDFSNIDFSNFDPSTFFNRD